MHWPWWRLAVAERSMEPALRPGDWVLVRRAVRPGRAVRVRPGQMVVTRDPRRRDLLIVKRVARREGAGWWLAADNPAAGAVDSSVFGPVAPAAIEGRVVMRYRRVR